MSFTNQEQPVEGQDPQVTPDPTPAAAAPQPAAPAAPSPAGDGPWANDLATMFTDPETRTAVDGFLRTKVQPYTTQLEQRAAASSDATQLWDALSENPVDTYVAMTAEMFGEDAAQALLGQLQNQLAAQEGQQPQPPEGGSGDPRIDEMYQHYQNTQAENYYNQELNRITTEHPEVVDQFFHKYVTAADGDFEDAYQLYSSEMGDIAQRFGVDPSRIGELLTATGEATPPAERVAAPPVHGSDSTAAQPSTTPTEPKKQTLDEAITDFMAEQRASRQAPPVGGV